ncbi:MAG TPA: BON domain-containing protein [Candidatus Melainabacteria bacterium]|jgi:hyperosmotically inducible periplasmic protein|nr:BON domain-containing protein [Candidatus Melainabacteria bacterium]HIN63472.1 BON domain-containing protein [Candidatus Obscuribacterales bacterium]
MKSRAFSTFSSVLAALAIMSGAALANNRVTLNNRIDEAEKTGSVSREAIVQLRADQKALEQQEAEIRAKYDGLLPARKGVKLTKARKKLIAKLDKMESKKPDNTAQNYGDSRKESPTPQVQSEKKADIDRLQSIRKELVNDKSLSINAKNVKVVVINGTVTLRGVVNSESEKVKVASAARKFADDSKVLDELEVNAK